jgi:hypothetical protein
MAGFFSDQALSLAGSCRRDCCGTGCLPLLSTVFACRRPSSRHHRFPSRGHPSSSAINGSGKSTLLEAVAVACGLNPEARSRNFNTASRSSAGRARAVSCSPRASSTSRPRSSGSTRSRVGRRSSTRRAATPRTKCGAGGMLPGAGDQPLPRRRAFFPRRARGGAIAGSPTSAARTAPPTRRRGP